MTLEVDLNSDLGEGAAFDAEIIPLVTSVNIACGFHAGDPSVARTTLQLAHAQGVAIGAHPGHPDREHFGRRELPRPPAQVAADCIYQVGALVGLARSLGAEVRYLKPHGGLYHQACREDAYAEAVISSAALFGLAVLGLPGSRLEACSQGRCRFVAEGFADRRYRPDGSLVPRDQAEAFIDDPAEAVVQVEWLLRERGVRSICVHGDNPKAIEFIVSLREALRGQGIQIHSFA